MDIETKVYDSDVQGLKRPLMVGCSGGGGHISAILGIQQYLQKRFAETVVLTDYSPVLFTDKRHSPTSEQIRQGMAIMHAEIVGKPVKALVGLSPFPVLPQKAALDAEIQALHNKEKNTKMRPYVDMLLDVYPSGYESAAIWNVLQRNDETRELKKLIDLQSKSDSENYQAVYQYYLSALNEARNAGSPFTEVISTQAMALPALCDAVKDYNEGLLKSDPHAQTVVIHQYMTDLPTKGAVHFFNVLSRLTPAQQQQMKLYGVEMNPAIIEHFFPNGSYFNGLYSIPAEQNPMVRPGFMDPSLDNSSKFHQKTTITLKDEPPFTIKADEQIAAIMLGSQASNDTVEYIETLLNKGMSKVFVFGGKNKNISEKIDEIIAKNPAYQANIIRLGNQGDKEIVALMTRSNIAVIRGGGLSVMEQMAMPHNEEQTILIHHANSEAENLSSGISWEDDNVTFLMEDLHAKNVYAQKTSPNRASRHIAEAQLINFIKSHYHANTDTEGLIIHVQSMSAPTLDQCSRWLKKGDKTSYKKIENYFADFISEISQEKEKLYLKSIEKLNKKCEDLKSYLAQLIENEVSTLNDVSQYFKTDERRVLIMDQYDVDKVVKDIHEDRFPSTISANLLALTKSYISLTELQQTLSPKRTVTAKKKLQDFQAKYLDKENQTALFVTGDSKIKQFFEEIVYLLVKALGSKKLDSSFFSPALKLKKTAAELVESDEEDEDSDTPHNTGRGG